MVKRKHDGGRGEAEGFAAAENQQLHVHLRDLLEMGEGQILKTGAIPRQKPHFGAHNEAGCDFLTADGNPTRTISGDGGRMFGVWMNFHGQIIGFTTFITVPILSELLGECFEDDSQISQTR